MSEIETNSMYSISAVVVTLNRPDCVNKCLAALASQVPAVSQVVVVDGSEDERTQNAVSIWPGVLYLRNGKGLGYTTLSRNIALQHVTGTLVAFLDDDAYVRAGWAQSLINAFRSDQAIGAVAGRALNNQPNEAEEGVEQVGRLTGNGEVLGFFSADTGGIVDVDHAIGCNMCIRRDVLARCGGFREGFSGRYCFREESDIFIVMKAMGYRVVFQPLAVVDHIAGPKPKGKRFDIWYSFYCERNHYILLVRNFGVFDKRIWRYLVVASNRIAAEALRKIAGSLLRLIASIGGTVSGLLLGAIWRIRQGNRPERTDEIGRAISAALGRTSNRLEGDHQH